MRTIQSEFQFVLYFNDDEVPTKGVLITRNSSFDEAVIWAKRQMTDCPTLSKCMLTEVLFGMPVRKRVITR